MSSSGENDRAQQRDATEARVESIALAYLTCPQTPDRGHVGALLITDYRTRPLHFSYVSPIRPTTIQRLLYGRTLNSHVSVDVIASKLLSGGTPLRPAVLFVDSPELLEVRRVCQWPVAHLHATNPDTTQLSTMRYDIGDHHQDSETVGRIVANLESITNLLDPFVRVREALKEALKAESPA
jgi:hypothetical protein